MTDDEVKALVKQAVAEAVATIPGARVEVLPAEYIRHEYQRRAVERTMEKVTSLKEDEREVVRYMLGQAGKYVPMTQIVGALGKSNAQWGATLKALVTLGVVGTAERQGSKPRLREWVAEELAPHSPTDTEVDEVYQAVLGRIAGASK